MMRVFDADTGESWEANVADLSKFPESADEWLRLEQAWEKKRDPCSHEDVRFLLAFWWHYPGLLAWGEVLHFPLTEDTSVRGQRFPECRARGRLRHAFHDATVPVLELAAEARGLDSAKVGVAAEVYGNYAQRWGTALLQELLWTPVRATLGPPAPDEPLRKRSPEELAEVLSRETGWGWTHELPSLADGPDAQALAQLREGEQVLERLKNQVRLEKVRARQGSAARGMEAGEADEAVEPAAADSNRRPAPQAESTRMPGAAAQRDGSKAPEYVWASATGGWEVVWRGKRIPVSKNYVGMRYIRELLTEPGTKIEARELLRRCAAAALADGRARLSATEAAEDGLAAEGLVEHPDRLADYDREEIQGAKALLEAQRDKQDDPAMRAVKQEQIDAIDAYTRNAFDLWGKPRPMGSRREGARKAISEAIRRARKALRDHEELWKHLEDHVRTGNECSYTGEIRWVCS
mgnify:CR=1 FL=1